MIGVPLPLHTFRYASCTSFTAIGCTAGPDNPPVTFANLGVIVSTSIAIAGVVFARHTASAPGLPLGPWLPRPSPSIAARTNSAIPIPHTATDTGLNFTNSRVCRKTSRTRDTSSDNSRGSAPNSHPPCTFGHDTFSSTAINGSRSSIAAATRT